MFFCSEWNIDHSWWCINSQTFIPGDDNEGPHGVPSGQSGAVSDRDIMKAEGIQPNEMSDLNHFLETSNKVNSRGPQEAEMSDTKFIPSSEEQSPISSGTLRYYLSKLSWYL